MLAGAGLTEARLDEVLAAFPSDTTAYYRTIRALGGRAGAFRDSTLQSVIVTGYDECRRLLGADALSKKRLRFDAAGLPPGLAEVVSRAQAVIDLQMTFDDSDAAHRSHQSWTRQLRSSAQALDAIEADAAALWRDFDSVRHDFYAALRRFVSRTVARTLTLDEADRERLFPLVYAYADFLDGKPATAQGLKAAVGAAMLADFVAANFRRLSKCAHAPVDDVPRWIADYVLTLVAGHESTAYLLGVALVAAQGRPAAFATPRSIRLHLREALRFDSPIQLVGRVTAAPVQLTSGCMIGGGERVLLHVGAANRDPAQFEAPDLFDPERRGRGALSFGWGASRCIGLSLSLAQASLFLAAGANVLAGRTLAVEEVTTAHGLAGRSFDRLRLALM